MEAIKIVRGSKAEFDLYLQDEKGFPRSLEEFSAADLAFVNCDGERTVVSLPLTGGKSGKIHVEITSEETAGADDKWASADLILTDQDDEPHVEPLTDYFEIVEPYAPSLG